MTSRLALAAIACAIPVLASAAETIPVTPDNFTRAESDRYLGGIVADGGFGKFFLFREPSPIDHQTVIRLNRDTLYGAAVFDLDAGPVTVTLPEAKGRFRSLQVIDEDQYTPHVIYDAGTYTFSREEIGTRYILLGLRILVDPNDPDDLAAVHALQDATLTDQPGGPGSFEVPSWDPASQSRVRDALIALSVTLPDTRNAFGPRGAVDPVRRLIESAAAWGGNPDKDALYLNATPARNDGSTVYRLKVGAVPVDGFWSISVYNAEGYYEPNSLGVYNLNSVTAAKDPDGSVSVQFGGCDGKVPNCMPTVPGWNYMVRLYRPQAAVLDGSWTFPEAVPQ